LGDVLNKETIEEIFAAFFIGFGFPSLIFGLAIDNTIEIVGGAALFIIGICLLLTLKRARYLRRRTTPPLFE
jgi:hypothetical protein